MIIQLKILKYEMYKRERTRALLIQTTPKFIISVIVLPVCVYIQDILYKMFVHENAHQEHS